MSGVYGIAFAVSLAFCKEPAYAYLNHDNSKLRSYPLKCLHNVVLNEFLSKPETRKSIFIKAHTVPLYCSRRMPENNFMFQCTKCQQLFHPDCQLRDQIQCSLAKAFKNCKMSGMSIKMKS